MKVTAKGYTTPSLSESGTLPNGVSFVDNGTGTAGTYSITITTKNSTRSATQSFVLRPFTRPAR